jgi:hypothetical protein
MLMSTRSYAELPDEYFERYFETYRELCSKGLGLRLLLGFGAQVVALSSLFEVFLGRPLMGLVIAVTFPPFFIYQMFLVFIQIPPPITPRAYRRLLLLVVGWFAANTVVSVISAPVWSRTAPGSWVGVAVVGVVFLLALTAIVTIVKYHNKFRSLELEFGYFSDRRGA